MIDVLIDRFQHRADKPIQTGKINHLDLTKSRVERFGGYSYARWDKPYFVIDRYPLNVWMELDYD